MCFITYKIYLLDNLNASPWEVIPITLTCKSQSIILSKESMSIKGRQDMGVILKSPTPLFAPSEPLDGLFD